MSKASRKIETAADVTAAAVAFAHAQTEADRAAWSQEWGAALLDSVVQVWVSKGRLEASWSQYVQAAGEGLKMVMELASLVAPVSVEGGEISAEKVLEKLQERSPALIAKYCLGEALLAETDATKQQERARANVARIMTPQARSMVGEIRDEDLRVN